MNWALPVPGLWDKRAVRYSIFFRVLSLGNTIFSLLSSDSDNAKPAKEKNIQLVTTDLKGTDVADIRADFEFNESGTEITSCAGGFIPKTNVYDKNTQKCKTSFPIETCKGYPHFSECNPVLHKRAATIKLAQRTAYHA